ncbi:PLP-dependent aminotransferase family protein [Methylobacterium sp. WL64]|uniref:aminotransferase-like domain-containing protein n=1 Tax=Methylobacterium sp. WL64 TaxID=2603894 RepID=UPI0011C94EF6|nr:PLP-dependent aminotransferase family protein [Methylobacterium sp. WL64]TXN01590.1 PLP-dependent aminotransferase family protein [Methylobacterium sp. WL64]
MAVTDQALAWTQLFGDLDRSGLALHFQIRRAIVTAIERGLFTAQARLPSTRQLATLLGVARNTVVNAYQQLIDEGFLVAHERSGIFLAPDLAVSQAPTAPGGRTIDWSERLALRPARLRQITKPRDWLDYPYPFLFGQFDPSLFPANDWRESVRAASGVSEINAWAGDLIDEDDPDLVDQLRLQVLPRRGIFASADEVMVTIGSQQALSLLIQLLVGRNTPAGVEDPCYPDTRNMLTLATDDLATLAIDRQGVMPDATFASRRVAFVTVGHQCPTTAVMPLERRRALLEAARRHDVVLVEDDYEADLALSDEIPALKSLDADGRVVYVGSFSKVLAPGLRVGYVVAPRAVIAELRVLRRLMLRHPPSNNQRATAMFVALGHYRTHLRRTASVLEERASRIAGLLPRLMPRFSWRRDPGATSFWMKGPAGLDARDLSLRARARGVLIEPGDIFFADPDAGRACFRLGFASIRTDRIEAGLTHLSELIGPAGAPLSQRMAEQV